jgi:hypothetical protein
MSASVGKGPSHGVEQNDLNDLRLKRPGEEVRGKETIHEI